MSVKWENIPNLSCVQKYDANICIYCQQINGGDRRLSYANKSISIKEASTNTRAYTHTHTPYITQFRSNASTVRGTSIHTASSFLSSNNVLWWSVILICLSIYASNNVYLPIASFRSTQHRQLPSITSIVGRQIDTIHFSMVTI